MFEGPVTGNIPEVLDNGEVTDGTHVTAGQLALALTPYAQVTDLAVNTAASGNNAAAIQSLGDRVTAELASKLDSSALAPAIAELADHGSLQQGRPVGLRRAGGRGGHYATLATAAANYGLKTVVGGQRVTAAALASELASRDASISGLQASKADASALTTYALQSTVDTSSDGL